MGIDGTEIRRLKEKSERVANRIVTKENARQAKLEKERINNEVAKQQRQARIKQQEKEQGDQRFYRTAKHSSAGSSAGDPDDTITISINRSRFNQLVKLLLKTALIVFVLYVATGPFRVLYNIRSGAINNDQDKLEKSIDFPALRANLKAQLHVRMDREMDSEEMRGNPFAGFAKGLATMMSDSLIDRFTNPETIAAMTSNSDSKGDGSFSESISFLFQADYEMDSMSKVIVIPPNSDTKLVLKRKNVTWKMVNMIIPNL